jgi:isochorismate synthase
VEELVDQAMETARELGQTVLVTHTEPLPFAPDALGFLAAGSMALGNGVLWSQPNADMTIAGAGVAHEIVADGTSRFDDVSFGLKALRRSLVGNVADRVFPVVGGFAFDDRASASPIWSDFPGARFIVPLVSVQTGREGHVLRVTLKVSPDDSPIAARGRLSEILEGRRRWARSDFQEESRRRVLTRQPVPPQQTWESSVARAITSIQEAKFEKVVLAREERLLAESPFSPVSALRHLGSFDPAATLFAMQSGDSWFIGATPERLVRLERGRVDVTCLAGSIGIGQSPEERRSLATQLLASAKDREEHEIVVRSTQAALEEVCESVVRQPNTPRVAASRSVQHLETPLTGYLPRGGDVLELVERLHPTPAVGGYPRDRALAAIRELETIERGWYAGPFGWVDLDGAGEFAVAIRSALVSGTSASLFAGCGIVAGSEPRQEFEETNLKLRPMREALGAL